MPKEEVFINYIINENSALDKLNEMKFDIIFGAPHYSGFKSYKYNNKKFQQSVEYYS